jgi:hypothetical protein
VPAVVLFNKCDLEREWEVDEATIAGVVARGYPTLKTSAKDGTGVEEAFAALTRLMLV